MRYIISILLMMVILGRNNLPFQIIESGSNITDIFEDCRKDTYNAPYYYYIYSTDNITVTLINNNQPIIKYQLSGCVHYTINLKKRYSHRSKDCKIVTYNNNSYPIIVKAKYGYPPIWKRVLYFIGRYGNIEYHNMIWD